MKIKINNKIFKTRYNEQDKIIIMLDNDLDRLFFKKWKDKSNGSIKKEDYVEDVDFIKVTERGVLKNCFPLINMNEDYVELIYDSYKVIN